MISTLGTIAATLMFFLGAVISVSEPGEGQGLIIASLAVAVLAMAAR